MAAPGPGHLHSLYTEEDIKIRFRCNHALQNLNPPAADPEHEHLAFIIIFEHQTRKQFCCSGNLHLLPLITSAADYRKWHPRPNFSLSAPLFGLPTAPDWPAPHPLLKGHLVPAFLEKSECPPASASRVRIFEYLGYHRIVSIEYHPGSSTKSLAAQELPVWLCDRYNERFPVVPKLSRFPMRQAPKDWLSRSGIEHAILTIESVEEPKSDQGAIRNQRGSRGRGHAKVITKEEEINDWIMLPESLTSKLWELPNEAGDVISEQK